MLRVHLRRQVQLEDEFSKEEQRKDRLITKGKDTFKSEGVNGRIMQPSNDIFIEKGVADGCRSCKTRVEGAVHDTKSSQSSVKKNSLSLFHPPLKALARIVLALLPFRAPANKKIFMGGSEQARRPLLVADQEDAPYHRSSNGGVDGNSSATGFLVFSTIVAATCSFTSGYCIGYSSPAEYGVLADLRLSMAEYSVFGSMLAVGGMVGALMSGKTADYFGHRTTMWIINIFFILGWLAIAFAKVSWLLDLGRLLQGIGIALTSYVGNIFIAEITPKNLRGGLMTFNPWMTGSGVAIVYLIGSVVKWRGLALIGSIPCLLQMLCLFFVPESPRWLVKNGREKEFEGVLQRLRGKKADISPEAAEIKEYAEFIQLLSENKILDLFQKKYARPIIVAVGLMTLTQFSGLPGYTFYMTNIFVLAGISSEAGYVTLAIVKILSTTMAIFLIDKFGRRTLLMVSAAGTCLGSLLTGFSFSLQDDHYWISSLALMGVSVYFASFNLGISGIPWIIMSEIFPVNVKGSAGSLCNLIYWFSSWVVSYTFNFLLEWSSTGTFIIFAGVSAFGFLFTVMLVPETKGRSLEEIQASVTNVLH
uniref:Sugar transporter family protein n=2 Tax=Populus alba TaxID=43335 RepID=A0A4U5QPU0_POPAL|nr:sugar transporter family protein [Populus alba]